MNKYQINRKTKLMRAGLTQTDIARMCGVSRQTVSKVMLGDIVSRRIAETVCRLCRTPFEQFFPEAGQRRPEHPGSTTTKGA